MNSNRKTFAFTAYGKVYQSGWTSDNRRYSSVPPESVLSKTGFIFAPDNCLDKKTTSESGETRTIPGSYNASHVEAQALCDVYEGIPILVSRPMCPSCQNLVSYLAQVRKVTYHVGTPDSVRIFSEDGSIATRSYPSYRTEGETSNGIEWSIEWSIVHKGRQSWPQSTMHLKHPNNERSDYSVSVPLDAEGPRAYACHTLFDGIVEKVMYLQSKETFLRTEGPSGLYGSDYCGPSNGVREKLGDGEWGRLPPWQL